MAVNGATGEVTHDFGASTFDDNVFNEQPIEKVEPNNRGYLGEFRVDLKETPFSDFGPKEWAMYYIGSYGQIDGGHHKQWVLDQVARILKGTPVIIKEARWENGVREYRVDTGSPSQEYLSWVEEMKYDEVNDEEYDYDEGIAP